MTATTIPGPLFEEFKRQVGAEFLAELEQAIQADELTDEDAQLLTSVAGLTRYGESNHEHEQFGVGA